MNGKKYKRYKPRECYFSDEVLAEIAEKLSQRFYEHGEIQKMVKAYGFTGDAMSVINYLEARNYLVATERKQSKHGFKTNYRVMTKEVYEKIEEEYREDAKRRLLAAVSY